MLNFQNADLQEVVEVILGQMLEENYVIDPGVSGVISTNTPRGLSESDLLPVLESLLRTNGAVLTRDGAMYRITTNSQALAQTSPTLFAHTGYGIEIVRLEFIAATEMHKILQPVLKEGAILHVDEQRNLMLVTGSLAERQRYLEMVGIFDVDWMRGMSIGLFPLRYVEPKALESEIKQALGSDGGGVLNGLVRLIPIERLNALLAVCATSSALNEIQRWIERLDITSDRSAPRLFVYRLQNAKAVDVADLLNEIFTSDKSNEDQSRRLELAPGAAPRTLASPAAEASVETAPVEPVVSAADLGIVVATVGENARIMADKTNNALVVLGTPREYETIESAIRKLDVIPLQVLIEATIVEVSLQDSLEYGVEWFFKNNLGDSKQGLGLLDLGAAGLASTAPSFSYAVIDNVDDVRAILNLLATESRLNVLSSPSLMVLDNQTATINVGDQIPIPTRQSTSNFDPLAPTVNEIEYRDTGISLAVTPRVNAGGLVTMEIEQEVSDAVATTSSELNAPTIQQRRIASVVAVQSGDTVVLGGLIRTSKSVNESGLPYVRKIPLLGKLFGQTSDFGRRTELLVLISPRAINDGQQAREVTREFRDRLRGLSGDDVYRTRY